VPHIDHSTASRAPLARRRWTKRASTLGLWQNSCLAIVDVARICVLHVCESCLLHVGGCVDVLGKRSKGAGARGTCGSSRQNRQRPPRRFSHNVRKRPEFLFRNWHANSLRMDAISFSQIPAPGAAKVVSCASHNEIMHSCCGIT
jgi:hypothetical protein